MSGGLIIHAMDSGPYHLHNHRRYLCFVSSGLQLPSYPAAFPPTFCNPSPMWRGHPTTPPPTTHIWGKGTRFPVQYIPWGNQKVRSHPLFCLTVSFYTPLLLSDDTLMLLVGWSCTNHAGDLVCGSTVNLNRLGLENHPLLLLHNYLGGSLTCSP